MSCTNCEAIEAQIRVVHDKMRALGRSDDTIIQRRNEWRQRQGRLPLTEAEVQSIRTEPSKLRGLVSA